MIEKYRPPEERLKSLLQQPATRRQILDGAGKTLVAARNRFFLQGAARPLVNMAVDAAVAQVIDPPEIAEPERDLEKEDQERRAKERQLAISALEEAEEMCERVAIMNHGKVIAMDRTQALMEQMQEKRLLVHFLDQYWSLHFYPCYQLFWNLQQVFYLKFGLGSF